MDETVENAPFDIFTIVHVIGGATLWALKIPRVTAYVAIILFEIIERPVFGTSPCSPP